MVIGPVARVLCVVLVCGACDKTAPPPAPAPTPVTPPSPPAVPAAVPAAARPPAPEPGSWYLARLTFEKVGDLPFFLHLPPKGQAGRAYIVNGDDTVDLQAAWHADEVTVTAPWTYVSVIKAQLQPTTGTLEGTWTRETPMWDAVVRDFSATPIASPDPRTRFPAGPAGDAAKHVDMAGTWKFQFAEHEVGKGVFQQTPDGVVTGYVKPGQLGALPLLGNLRGRQLSLSQFNANAANLVLARISADGKSMSGLMSMQNVWNEKFTAKKVADFEFINTTHLKRGTKTVSLRGLDKYKGKPTLAIIFSTWCPPCNEATPYLEHLYATYHAKGLEVMEVAYDLSEDEHENLAELEAYRAKYKIPWELLQVPCTPETWAKSMPPEIEGWDGLPILLLVRRAGTVQTIYGGWFGSSTGADGEKLRAWFEESTKTLLAGS